MPTAYILWDRKAQTIVSSSGTPVIFASSADATNHVTTSLDAKRGNQPQKSFDVLTVTIN